ncbi:hypothetical protein M9H77_16625 [Catharanthus roseus]|uniref:Uncharacterized protein n=1 Tax=Catharanthus roseus TaxID=4058 RepID=A0ACC0B2G5_CATRO|nr:hypothetical protein M9H77_16625 [Catharanthus roseus]
MLGIFAYKAAALVQVYRDNEDLQFIFPENEERQGKQEKRATRPVDSLARSTWILVWEMLIFTVSQRRRKSQRICGRRFTSMLFTLHMATICLRMMKMHCSTTWLETSSQRHKQRDG